MTPGTFARALVAALLFALVPVAAIAAPSPRTPVRPGPVAGPTQVTPAIPTTSASAPDRRSPAAVIHREPGPVPIAWTLPFVGLLACIALMPFVARHWWERNYRRVSVGLAVLVGAYYVFYRHTPGDWLKEMQEYVSFMVLLGSLFVVSGGIAIRINRLATPLANATLLLIGAVVANIFGTTGAAMLLIRPYLRMNRAHIKKYHVVFFIFIIANVGGSLTPIGDPPLFLGYLKGVPFWWVMEHMKLPWLLAVCLLVATFTVIDTLDHKREEREHDGDPGPQVHILGIHNFLFIGVIVWGVFRPSFFDAGGDMLTLGVTPVRFFDFVFSRELLMLAAAFASRRLTQKSVYTTNDFTFGPIKEVAVLFVGIFSTMVPALGWLEHNAKDLHIHSPGQFYYASGALSSVLDNAPTYVTFLQTRLAEIDKSDIDQAQAVLAKMKGQEFLTFDPKTLRTEQAAAAVGSMIKYHEDDVRRGTIGRDQLEVSFLLGLPSMSLFIVAISAGSVFWGACTYIGNGPNFMVKSIADASGVKTPGFLEYIYRYTLPILIPIYVVVWAVFFLGY
jgi:Na+/H+ antiporter NhaD/arsenite permease-like protein